MSAKDEWRFRPNGRIVGVIRRDPASGAFMWRTAHDEGEAATFAAAQAIVKPRRERPDRDGNMIGRRLRDWAVDRWLRQ